MTASETTVLVLVRLVRCRGEVTGGASSQWETSRSLLFSDGVVRGLTAIADVLAPPAAVPVALLVAARHVGIPAE
jgi:hypothetical protein